MYCKTLIANAMKGGIVSAGDYALAIKSGCKEISDFTKFLRQN